VAALQRRITPRRVMRSARTAPRSSAGAIAQRAITATPIPALTISRIASVKGTFRDSTERSRWESADCVRCGRVLARVTLPMPAISRTSARSGTSRVRDIPALYSSHS
jgi:hypothetical protein